MPALPNPPSIFCCAGPGSTSSVASAGTWSGSVAQQKLSLLQDRQPQLPLPLLAGQVLQFPTITVALSWTRSWVWAMSLCLGLGTKSFSSLFYSTSTSWYKYSGDRNLLFSAFFPLWSQLPSHFSVLLKASRYLVCSRMERCVLCRDTWPPQLGMEGGLSLCSNFYLQVVWERGKKSEFFPFKILCFNLTSASFGWTLSFLIQSDFESPSFSNCFAWL